MCVQCQLAKKRRQLRAFKYQTRFLFLSLSQFQDIEIFFLLQFTDESGVSEY